MVSNLWTVSLNFSSSRNCRIRKTSSLLREVIPPGISSFSSVTVLVRKEGKGE